MEITLNLLSVLKYYLVGVWSALIVLLLLVSLRDDIKFNKQNIKLCLVYSLLSYIVILYVAKEVLLTPVYYALYDICDRTDNLFYFYLMLCGFNQRKALSRYFDNKFKLDTFWSCERLQNNYNSDYFLYKQMVKVRFISRFEK